MRITRPLVSALSVATLCVSSIVTLTAVSGVVAPPPAVALENGLARTPPMGFNNWNFTHCGSSFNEAMVLAIADRFVSLGLRDVGYQYVNIDDCWALPQRNASGNLVPDPNRFPRGIKFLADYVHARGLKFGIYTSAGTKTCNSAGFPGGLGHEQQDANLFASWDVDYLKYDNCNNQGVDAIQRYTTMRNALANTGRPIVYSVTEWGQNQPWLWAPQVGNLWRTTGDISDNWGSMIARARINRTYPQYAQQGAWNDPDMLQVGNGGMTTTEYRSHFSLWAIMAAPLLIGTDLRTISTANLDILRDPDVIAVNQDPLGHQGVVVSSSGGLVVYVKHLANGDKAVLLSNENTATATISTTASAIGMGPAGSYTLRDLWANSSRSVTSSISASVPGHGVVMYRVSANGATAPTGTVQLSDRNWISASNGWGPVERDRSNGQQAAGDGATITLNGTTYAKGLGAHAISLVTYHLGGACSSVTADVGLDDEVAGNGSVIFTLWRDATKVADSGRMTGSTATRTLTANLSGGTRLTLAVYNALDGINSDHADWANARVTCGGGGVASYEGEVSGNTFNGTAAPASCSGCSGGQKVRFIGNSTANWVAVNNVNVTSAGNRTLTVFGTVDGTRSFSVSVNGAPPTTVSLTGTSWATPVSTSITVPLTGGNNSIRFFNDSAFAPDLDRITVG